MNMTSPENLDDSEHQAPLSDEQIQNLRSQRLARYQELRPQILNLVRRPEFRPAKPRVITHLLGLDATDVTDVRRAIKRLVQEGHLKFGPKHLVLPIRGESPAAPATARAAGRESRATAQTRSREVVGIYRKTSQAFGFVTPEDYFGNDRAQDIFIPPRKQRDASDGDRVRVRLLRPTSPDLQSGRVVEVLDRKTNTFIGTYRTRGADGFVMVDGDKFPEPIYVGDASAKNCRSGDKVVIDMVHFPAEHQAGEAVITRVLGPRGEAGVDTEMILVEFNLPREFPENALAEARRQAELFDEEDLTGRTDFTKKIIATIDPRTARDFDDAISLERLETGNWELGVHIADVAHFVRRGTPLDDEAFRRGNSVYLPDLVIPMLPEIISNNLASLQPHKVRYTMSVMMEITPEGEVLHAEWHRGAIRSAHRFNYEEIDEYLANPEPWREKLTPEVFRLVAQMHELAMPMRERRLRRGAIDLALPQVSIDLDDQGQVAGAHVESYTESHQIIEEFMLAANEAVAQKLYDLELFYLRRIHEAPSEKKLRDLTEFVTHLGIPCESLQSRFEIKRVLEIARDRQDRQAVNFAVLRSMQKAIYSPKESGHYALASKQYCHFTSPIRRYPDLIIHRMVADLLDGKKPLSDFEKLEKWGQHCSDTEQRAEQAERELIKLKLLNFLAQRIGWEMPACITGVEAFGLFVQGIDLPAEGLLPLENLPTDQYWFDDVTRTLQGRRKGNEFRLGDRLLVRIQRVDPDRRTLTLALADPRSNGSPSPDSPRSSGSAPSSAWGESGRGRHAQSRSTNPPSRNGRRGGNSSSERGGRSHGRSRRGKR